MQKYAYSTITLDGQPLVCASLGYSYLCFFSINLLTLVRTGMKCLPRSKIPQANGTVLHDWHAEILAVRAFNRFLIYECATEGDTLSPSRYVRQRRVDEICESFPQPFELEAGVSIYMYCSEAPCGDASMELIMQAQDDPTPWEIPLGNHDISEQKDELKGRGYFSELGVVRRKPGELLLVLIKSKSLIKSSSFRCA